MKWTLYKFSTTFMEKQKRIQDIKSSYIRF